MQPEVITETNRIPFLFCVFAMKLLDFITEYSRMEGS